MHAGPAGDARSWRVDYLLGQYTLTQGDINAGNVHNVSTADSNETPPTETPNDVPVPKAPAISLVKSATPATYATLGQTISYSSSSPTPAT